MKTISVFILLLTATGSMAPAATRASDKDAASARFTLIYADPKVAMEPRDLMRAIAVVTYEVVLPGHESPLGSLGVGLKQVAGHGPGGLEFSVALISSSKDQARIKVSRGDDQAFERSVDLIGRLKELVASHTRLAPEELAEQLDRLRKERAELQRKKKVLTNLVSGYRDSRKDLLAERIKTMEAERGRLEMERVATDARARALHQEMARLSGEAKSRLHNDRVSLHLKKVLELRQREANLIQKMVGKSASESDFRQAEGRVAEVEVELAERAEQVLRGEQEGQLLGRLANELAMLAIDQAEKRSRLEFIRERFPQLDPKDIDEASLDRVAEKYSSLLQEEILLPPLYYELDRREADLLKRELAHTVSDVRVETLEAGRAASTTVPSTTP